MVKSQPILRYILRVAPAIAVAVLLSACSSTSTARNMHSETHAVGSGDLSSLQASQDEFETMVRNLDVKSRLMDQYASWKGVRYRLGGSTRKGIDCSAFVQRTSANNLVWNCRVQLLNSRKPENRFPVPNCGQAIWFCFAPALPAAMSGSTSATTSLFTPPPAAG